MLVTGDEAHNLLSPLLSPPAGSTPRALSLLSGLGLDPLGLGSVIAAVHGEAEGTPPLVRDRNAQNMVKKCADEVGFYAATTKYKAIPPWLDLFCVFFLYLSTGAQDT
jgi:hypothetical protein